MNKCDYQELTVEQTTSSEKFRATYDNAKKAVKVLYDKFGGSPLFGNEKDEFFQSSINTIYQTFGGQELYPSIEEKAVMFYLVTKNHSFSDGNKRKIFYLYSINVYFRFKNGKQ